MLSDFNDDRNQFNELIDGYTGLVSLLTRDEVLTLNAAMALGAEFFKVDKALPIPPLVLIRGNSTSIETPQRSIDAFYSIVELDDLIPSHNPTNFTTDNRYPLKCQQRDYTRDAREQFKVTSGADHFNSKFVINDAPTATDGAPIITNQGFVLGGNGRTMMMKLLPDRKFDSEYSTRLAVQYRYFGFTQEQYDSFKKPVLVRAVNVNIKECSLYSNILNQNLTQEIDITTKTVSFARQLTDRDVELIGGLFEEYEGDTLASMLSTPKVVRKLQEIFRQAEIITAQNTPKWLESSDVFTSEGKATIEGILLGVILDDKELIEAARSFTEKFIRTLPLLLRMRRVGGEWNMTRDIIAVIRLESARRASKMNLHDFLTQVSFDRPAVSPKEELIWKVVSENSWLKWKNFLLRYVVMGEEAMNQLKSYGGFFNEQLTPLQAIERLTSKQGLSGTLSDYHDDQSAFYEIYKMYTELSPLLTSDEISTLNEAMALGIEYYELGNLSLPSAPSKLKRANELDKHVPELHPNHAPTITHKYSLAQYAEIVESVFIAQKLTEQESILAQLQRDLEEWENIPADEVRPMREWTALAKEKRVGYRGKRDAADTIISAIKKNQWNYADSTMDDETRHLINVAYNETNGTPTQEQINNYIEVLEHTSFDKVKNLDYYPTPPDIVARMIAKAELAYAHNVLEPSAGKGNIVDAIRWQFPELRIDVCELAEHNRKILELKGYHVLHGNFLELGVTGRTAKGIPIINPALQYDRIVMNPPFQNGTDWAHIHHAYKLLKPNGILVALAPANSYLSNSRDATERRLFIEEENAGTIEVIPAAEYNRNLEFTKLTIDIALITLTKASAIVSTSSPSQTLDFELDSKYQELPKTGEFSVPERTAAHIDMEFVKPKVVVAQEHLVPPQSSVDDYVAEINTPKPFGLFDYQQFGCNLAIKALCHSNTGNGFLLADGTGTGKTTEMLTIAAYTYQKYKRPVVIFTVDDRVIKTSFMKDAKRLRFPVPEYVEQSDAKAISRPEKYSGLYDKFNPDELFGEDAASFEPVTEANALLQSNTGTNLPAVYMGNSKTFKLRDGINIFKYTALSLVKNLVPPEIKAKKDAAVNALKFNEGFWKKILAKGIGEIEQNRFEQVGQVIYVPPEKKDRKKKELKDDWTAKIQKAGLDDTFILQQKFASLIKNIDRDNKRIVMPETEKAGLNYMAIIDIHEAAIQKILVQIISNTSLVIFDEAHKIKNLLQNTDVDATRAYYAKLITDSCDRVLFATATPCDRPYDILYLRRAGLFQGDDDFETKMGSLGIEYVQPKKNSDGQIVRKGKWSISKQDDDEVRAIINFRMAQLFAFIVRRGCMIRREIQYTNLTAKFVDVIVPEAVRGELQAITDSVTKMDGNGRMKIEKLKQMQRHLEHMEAYKIDETIEITKREVREGRSVIIFTNYVDEGDEPRAEDDSMKLGTVRILKNRLAKVFGEDAVGVLVSATPGYEDYRRLENVEDFQTGKRRILIGTITSGGTGVNLDDTAGNAPRTVIIMTAPLSFINVMQGIGRVVRANSASRSRVYFLFAKTDNPIIKNRSIAIESWLKRLIGYKFSTLKAAVEGEIGTIDPTTVERMEAGGAEAVATSVEETSDTPNKHSLYTQKEKSVKGWNLPSRLPLAVERYGNSRAHTVIIKGKSKADLEGWAKANQEFIDKWQLTKNVDSGYQVYNGTHYGRAFVTADSKNWQESYDVWNALLNIVKQEDARYLNNQTAQFAIGEHVVATTDVLSVNAQAGASGSVISMMPIIIGRNKSGDIHSYEYDVEFDGRIANNLQPWQIRSILEVVVPPTVSKYQKNDVHYDVSTDARGTAYYNYIIILNVVVVENAFVYEIGYDFHLTKDVFERKIMPGNRNHYGVKQQTGEEVMRRIRESRLEIYNRSESGLGDAGRTMRTGLIPTFRSKNLSTRIKENPYLKASNCTDLNDIEAACDSLRELDDEFGADNQTLLNIWARIFERKKILENKERQLEGLPPSTQTMEEQEVELTPADLGFYDHTTIMAITPNFIPLNRTQLLLEKIAKPFRMMIWGRQGSGKSSLALMFAEDVSHYGKTLCVLTDEKTISGRIGQTIGRLNINAKNILFNDRMDYSRLREFLTKNAQIEYVVIDSINELNVPEQSIVDLMNDYAEVSFVFVCQSTKDGKNHSSFGNLAYKVDTEITVENLKAIARKHRDGRTGIEFSILDKRAQRQVKKEITLNGFKL
ncbi:MAG: helicase-related protein [Candidatus Kapaibacterium sp.]